jgi:hypothetical protein
MNMPSDLSSCGPGWSTLEARLTVDESAIRSIVKIKMRNKKRRAYNVPAHCAPGNRHVRLSDDEWRYYLVISCSLIPAALFFYRSRSLHTKTSGVSA